jgi:parvulin-like peptidyl-prolyl isomerase
MSRRVRSEGIRWGAWVIAGLLVSSGEARSQAPAPAPSSAPAASKSQVPPGADEVVATVNDDKITKGELINFLSRYPVPTENREQIYHDAVDSLVNTKLVGQFLKRQNIQVPSQRIDEEIARLEQQLKASGQDLQAVLREDHMTIDDVQKELETRIKWSDYVKSKATDAELKRFVAANRDLFNGTQVRASHILLKVEPDATAEAKEKVRQKLLGIKKDIESGKISFAEAANKYSEDPANAGGGGGDLDYFTLSSGFIEEFTDVAFKLKKGTISDPVETPYGWHLIYVTDRKEGKAPDFEQNKPFIIQAYAGDLQKNLLTEARKTAKIDIKPMPKDLFPPAPPADNAPPSTGTAPQPKAAGANAPAPKP